jgi:hypothetical protein
MNDEDMNYTSQYVVPLKRSQKGKKTSKHIKKKSEWEKTRNKERRKMKQLRR